MNNSNPDQLLTARVIKHQFTRQGLNHLAVCYDNPPGTPEYHITHGPTLCGKKVAIGSGGWGYGPKDCPACAKLGAPAERNPNYY